MIIRLLFASDLIRNWASHSGHWPLVENSPPIVTSTLLKLIIHWISVYLHKRSNSTSVQPLGRYFLRRVLELCFTALVCGVNAKLSSSVKLNSKCSSAGARICGGKLVGQWSSGSWRWHVPSNLWNVFLWKILPVTMWPYRT